MYVVDGRALCLVLLRRVHWRGVISRGQQGRREEQDCCALCITATVLAVVLVPRDLIHLGAVAGDGTTSWRRRRQVPIRKPLTP